MSNTNTLAFLTLDDIKAQCRIVGNREDGILLRYGLAAERKLLKDIGRTQAEITQAEGCWPDDLTLAALMLCEQWYKYRSPVENVTLSVVPYGYEALYYPYRKATYSSTREEDE